MLKIAQMNFFEEGHLPLVELMYIRHCVLGYVGAGTDPIHSEKGQTPHLNFSHTCTFI